MKHNNISTKLPQIPNKRYFTIGEVGYLCNVKPHVLRYWEQEFPQLKPSKRRGNRRYYQREDVIMIRNIRGLLYDEGYTISGARIQLDQVIKRQRQAEKRTLKHEHENSDIRYSVNFTVDTDEPEEFVNNKKINFIDADNFEDEVLGDEQYYKQPSGSINNFSSIDTNEHLENMDFDEDEDPFATTANFTPNVNNMSSRSSARRAEPGSILEDSGSSAGMTEELNEIPQEILLQPAPKSRASTRARPQQAQRAYATHANGATRPAERQYAPQRLPQPSENLSPKLKRYKIAINDAIVELKDILAEIQD